MRCPEESYASRTRSRRGTSWPPVGTGTNRSRAALIKVRSPRLGTVLNSEECFTGTGLRHSKCRAFRWTTTSSSRCISPSLQLQFPASWPQQYQLSNHSVSGNSCSSPHTNSKQESKWQSSPYYIHQGRLRPLPPLLSRAFYVAVENSRNLLWSLSNQGEMSKSNTE